MADIKDVTAVIASALDEVSLTSTLDVKMDDGETVNALGDLGGEHVEVTVVVKRIEDDVVSAPDAVAVG